VSKIIVFHSIILLTITKKIIIRLPVSAKKLFQRYKKRLKTLSALNTISLKIKNEHYVAAYLSIMSLEAKPF